MTKTEKIIIGAIVVVLVVWLGLVVRLSIAVEEAGGVKQIIIDAGREVKDIAREIEKDE
jgi:hypothetical protein